MYCYKYFARRIYGCVLVASPLWASRAFVWETVQRKFVRASVLHGYCADKLSCMDLRSDNRSCARTTHHPPNQKLRWADGADKNTYHVPRERNMNVPTAQLLAANGSVPAAPGGPSRRHQATYAVQRKERRKGGGEGK